MSDQKERSCIFVGFKNPGIQTGNAIDTNDSICLFQFMDELSFELVVNLLKSFARVLQVSHNSLTNSFEVWYADHHHTRNQIIPSYQH